VGTGELLAQMATAGSDVVGIDWHVDLDEGRQRVGDRAVQGNLDPARCLNGAEQARQAAREVFRPKPARRRGTSSISATASCPRRTPTC
jgi:uroporphyrinogen decarboxylase